MYKKTASHQIKDNGFIFTVCGFVTDGVFGAMMQVHIENDGPVTIPLESPDNLPVGCCCCFFYLFHRKYSILINCSETMKAISLIMSNATFFSQNNSLNEMHLLHTHH